MVVHVNSGRCFFLASRLTIVSLDIYIYIIYVTKSRKMVGSTVFHHVFNCISTYAYVFPEYLLHNFDNLSIKLHIMIGNNVENVILFMLQ